MEPSTSAAQAPRCAAVVHVHGRLAQSRAEGGASPAPKQRPPSREGVRKPYRIRPMAGPAFVMAKRSFASKGPSRLPWWDRCRAQPGAKSCQRALCAQRAHSSMPTCERSQSHTPDCQHQRSVLVSLQGTSPCQAGLCTREVRTTPVRTAARVRAASESEGSVPALPVCHQRRSCMAAATMVETPPQAASAASLCSVSPLQARAEGSADCPSGRLLEAQLLHSTVRRLPTHSPHHFWRLLLCWSADCCEEGELVPTSEAMLPPCLCLLQHTWRLKARHQLCCAQAVAWDQLTVARAARQPTPGLGKHVLAGMCDAPQRSVDALARWTLTVLAKVTGAARLALTSGGT